MVSKEEALRTMQDDFKRLMDDPFTGGSSLFGGSLPELTDAETVELTDREGKKYLFAYPKGCGEQAWSVACAIWGLSVIGQTEERSVDSILSDIKGLLDSED